MPRAGSRAARARRCQTEPVRPRLHPVGDHRRAARRPRERSTPNPTRPTRATGSRRPISSTAAGRPRRGRLRRGPQQHRVEPVAGGRVEVARARTRTASSAPSSPSGARAPRSARRGRRCSRACRSSSARAGQRAHLDAQVGVVARRRRRPGSSARPSRGAAAARGGAGVPPAASTSEGSSSPRTGRIGTCRATLSAKGSSGPAIQPWPNEAREGSQAPPTGARSSIAWPKSATRVSCQSRCPSRRGELPAAASTGATAICAALNAAAKARRRHAQVHVEPRRRPLQGDVVPAPSAGARRRRCRCGTARRAGRAGRR